ncbi:MAG: hypothetical protein HYV07_20630 [Deltaproteobacteria bacterium]|nr:hypothetical protein [Deltaproteobacteria bacterium]
MLGRLGLPGGMVGAQLDALTGNPLGVLQNLRDAYQETAMGRGTSGFERMLSQGQFPPGMPMFSPGQAFPTMGPICGGGYMQREQVDLAAGTPNNFLSRIFNPQRRSAAKFEKMLKNNPAARQAFEQSIGGRIVGFGKNDGKMTIERFVPGPFAQPLQGMFGGLPGGLPSVAQSALAPLLQMAGSTMGMGVPPSLLGLGGAGALAGGALGLLSGGNPFMGMLAGGLQGITNGLMMGGGGFMPPIGGGFPGGGFPGGFPGAGGFGFGMINGAGVGSMNPLAMPGHINNTNPMAEQAHQQQVGSVLNDPSLTVEDKVTLMLMLITKKMDQDIERQTQYINSIQQQQGNRQGGGGKGGGKGGKGGGGAGGAGGNSAPSIDVETLKLQRMVTKRQQMFDMLKAIIDKYNETAKGVIQSLGR